MVLSHDELRSLTEARHRSPHQWLGMHPLGDGSGVVARALIPNAAKVEIQPVHEKQMPTVQLHRLDNTDVFEGATKEASRVYAYDLLITHKDGNVRRQAVRLSEPMLAGPGSHAPSAMTTLLALLDDPDPIVRFQLALSLVAACSASRRWNSTSSR